MQSFECKSPVLSHPSEKPQQIWQILIVDYKIDEGKFEKNANLL